MIRYIFLRFFGRGECDEFGKRYIIVPNANLCNLSFAFLISLFDEINFVLEASTFVFYVASFAFNDGELLFNHRLSV